MKNSKRLFSKDMLILGFVLQLRFMLLAVIFSIFAGGYLYAATPVLIAEENFEGVMSCKLSSVGSFPVSPGIKIGMGIGGSSAYGFGRSSCGANAWDGYVNDLIFTFSKKCVITKVEFWEIERYENWGSQGWLIANGNKINDTTFGRLPSNDRIADSSFRKREFALDIVSSGITFRCWDITDRSELFVDDIKIYGYIYDDTFTVAFNANGGVGDAIPIQGFSVNTPQKIFKNVYIKDGYVFQGWVSNSVERAELAAAGVIAVDYRDEELITVDSDMTLYAVWANPPPTLTVESADWREGTITLRCEDSDTSGAEHSYTLEYKENDAWVPVNDEVATNISVSADGFAHLTDNTFWSRLGGIPPVEYRVKDENGRVSAGCVTRNRHGIFVGLSAWNKSAYEGYVMENTGGKDAADKFENLAIGKGGFKSANVHKCVDSGATSNGVCNAFFQVSTNALPGDICVFFIDTHGGIFENGTSYLCLYDGRYTEMQLAQAIGEFDAANKGLAVIGIVSACHSGALFDNPDQSVSRISWYLRNGLAQCSPNIAWVTSSGAATSGFPIFNKFLFEYGWEEGWAGTGTTLTFADLANYTKSRYDALFSGIIFEDETESRKVQIKDESSLLSRIVAGEGGSHLPKAAPGIPSKPSASMGTYRERIRVSWEAVSDADEYWVFYRYGSKNDYTAVLSPFPKKDTYVNLEVHSSNQNEYYDFCDTSESFPALFVVKAVNGAGVSEMSIEAEGWVNILLRKVVFNGNGGAIPNSWDGTLIGGSQISIWVLQGEKLGLLPTADKVGFTLCGWFNGSQAATPETVIQDDVTYIARWTDMTSDYLSSHPTIATASCGDIAAAANLPAANGCRTVGECYALGINPEDPNDDLKISHFEIKDGKPVITLNHTEDGSGNSFMPRVKTLGKANLSDTEWREVPEDGDPTMRFFKVSVELP